MAAVDPNEVAFRAAVDAAVRAYEDDMSLKTSPLPALIDAITQAAASWVEEHGSTRFFEGRDQGWVDGQQAERDSHTCERD